MAFDFLIKNETYFNAYLSNTLILTGLENDRIFMNVKNFSTVKKTLPIVYFIKEELAVGLGIIRCLMSNSTNILALW